MKLRIQGNSLCLRFTRKEVAELLDRGRVESHIEFAPGLSLAYAIGGSPGATSVSAGFNDAAIVATVPTSMMRK
jgi:hypothetical protein